MLKNVFQVGLWIAGMLISVTLGQQIITIIVANNQGGKA